MIQKAHTIKDDPFKTMLGNYHTFKNVHLLNNKCVEELTVWIAAFDLFADGF